VWGGGRLEWLEGEGCVHCPGCFALAARGDGGRGGASQWLKGVRWGRGVCMFLARKMAERKRKKETGDLPADAVSLRGWEGG
jgi:hypothetical protein